MYLTSNTKNVHFAVTVVCATDVRFATSATQGCRTRIRHGKTMAHPSSAGAQRLRLSSTLARVVIVECRSIYSAVLRMRCTVLHQPITGSLSLGVWRLQVLLLSSPSSSACMRDGCRRTLGIESCRATRFATSDAEQTSARHDPVGLKPCGD